MDLATTVFILLVSAVGITMYFVFASFAFGAGYQPTPRRSVDAMFRLAGVGPSDTVYDLGAGTGAVIFRAANQVGATAVGVEVEPLRMLVLRLRRRLSAARGRITLVWGNLYALDFRAATVVAVFLWPEAMARLQPLLERQLRAGARVVSHYHPLPGYEPTAVDAPTKVYLYRWPAVPRSYRGP